MASLHEILPHLMGDFISGFTFYYSLLQLIQLYINISFKHGFKLYCL